MRENTFLKRHNHFFFGKETSKYVTWHNKSIFFKAFGKVKLKGVNELFIFSRDIIPFGKLRRKLNEQMFN